MRKVILGLVLAVALACASVAGATGGPSPHVLCGGQTCTGGQGGYTGCSSAQNNHSADVGISAFNHYLVISYCKVNGIITSVSVAAHGCDYRGIAYCTAGSAYLTSGGVGSSTATFVGHAEWFVPPVPIANSDTVYVTVNPG